MNTNNTLSKKLEKINENNIIKKSNIPIGIDNWANFNESINCPNSGIKRPTSKPTTMQTAIHNVRYFSQSPKDNSFFICSLLLLIFSP